MLKFIHVVHADAERSEGVLRGALLALQLRTAVASATVRRRAAECGARFGLAASRRVHISCALLTPCRAVSARAAPQAVDGLRRLEPSGTGPPAALGHLRHWATCGTAPEYRRSRSRIHSALAAYSRSGLIGTLAGAVGCIGDMLRAFGSDVKPHIQVK